MKLKCYYKYKIFSEPKAVEVYFPLMQQFRTGIHAGRPLFNLLCGSSILYGCNITSS